MIFKITSPSYILYTILIAINIYILLTHSKSEAYDFDKIWMIWILDLSLTNGHIDTSTNRDASHLENMEFRRMIIKIIIMIIIMGVIFTMLMSFLVKWLFTLSIYNNISCLRLVFATVSQLTDWDCVLVMEVELIGSLSTRNIGLSLASCLSSSTAWNPYFSW